MIHGEEMNLAQLEETLPNGFHDAKLTHFELDEDQGTAILQMRLLVSDPVEEASREVIKYKPAEISIKGLSVMEVPPELLQDQWSLLDVQGFIPNEKQWSTFANLDNDARQNSYSFFVHDWNTSIHMVASQAEVHWTAP